MTVTIKEKITTTPTAESCAQPFSGVLTPLEAAAAYSCHGMAALPIPHGSKAPTISDWPSFKYDTTSAASYFSGPTNIAIKLGLPSHGLVDLDLDTQEAIKLAPFFLPDTKCKFGHSTKPASHWIYRVADAGPTFKRQAILGQGKATVLLELRSTGALTVFPPSMHPSGEQIQFEEGCAGLPAEVSMSSLKAAANQLAVGTLLATAWPKSAGVRNELAMAIAGGMLRSGVPSTLVGKLLHRAAEAASDEEAEQRAEVVLATEAKIKKKALATGWPRAAYLLGDAGGEVVQKFRDWLGVSEKDYQGPEVGSKLASVLASEVAIKPVDWLWHQRLAYGALSILDGDPGIGKSTLCLDLAARVSTGAALPGGYACKPSGVLIISGEDSMETTVVPRLKAAGASLERVRIVGDVETVTGLKHPLSIPEDLDLLRKLILEMDARLVIIDPLMAYLSLKAHAHSDQQVRRALMPLADLAEEAGAAILVVRHLNKDGSKPALYRGGGSIGMIGAVRSAFIVGKAPFDPTARIFACNKSNLGPLPKSWKYRVVTKHILAEGKEIETSAIEWMETVDCSADQLLAVSAIENAKALDKAAAFLKELLKEGPMGPTAIFAEGAHAGHSEATLRRAAKKLGIEITQIHEGGKIIGWTWSLSGDKGPASSGESA